MKTLKKIIYKIFVGFFILDAFTIMIFLMHFYVCKYLLTKKAEVLVYKLSGKKDFNCIKKIDPYKRICIFENVNINIDLGEIHIKGKVKHLEVGLPLLEKTRKKTKNIPVLLIKGMVIKFHIKNKPKLSRIPPLQIKNLYIEKGNIHIVCYIKGHEQILNIKGLETKGASLFLDLKKQRIKLVGKANATNVNMANFKTKKPFGEIRNLLLLNALISKIFPLEGEIQLIGLSDLEIKCEKEKIPTKSSTKTSDPPIKIQQIKLKKGRLLYKNKWGKEPPKKIILYGLQISQGKFSKDTPISMLLTDLNLACKVLIENNPNHIEITCQPYDKANNCRWTFKIKDISSLKEFVHILKRQKNVEGSITLVLQHGQNSKQRWLDFSLTCKNIQITPTKREHFWIKLFFSLVNFKKNFEGKARVYLTQEDLKKPLPILFKEIGEKGLDKIMIQKFGKIWINVKQLLGI